MPRRTKGNRAVLSGRIPQELHDQVLKEINKCEFTDMTAYVNALAADDNGFPHSTVLLAGEDEVRWRAKCRRLALYAQMHNGCLTESLRRSCRDSGLPNRQFAIALGMSGTRLELHLEGALPVSQHTALHAETIAEALRSAQQAGWSTPPAATAISRNALLVDQQRSALATFLRSSHDLRSALDQDSQALIAWQVPPGSTRRVEWDAVLAALVEREFINAGRQAPAWTLRPWLYLGEEWVLANNDVGARRVRTTTPAWLGARNLFIAVADLGVDKASD